MGYAPDPGGVFASDTHRRVLSHVPDPGADAMGLHPLGHRISPDPHHGLAHVDDLQAVLDDLEAEGFVKKGKDDTYITTDEGMAALAAPAPETAGPVTPAVIDGLDAGDLLP